MGEEIFSTDKMFTYLKGFLDGANLPESRKALLFARKCHKDQFRKSGEPYISHPLTMACHATSLGIKDDKIIATILLHDVSEDCNIPIDQLPVNYEIRHSISLLTFKVPDGIEKEQYRKIYYENISNDYAAAIAKLFDRCNNVSTMAGVFDNERLKKYIKETKDYIYPLMKKVKENYPQYSDNVYALKYQTSAMIIACQLLVDSYEAMNKT